MKRKKALFLVWTLLLVLTGCQKVLPALDNSQQTESAIEHEVVKDQTGLIDISHILTPKQYLSSASMQGDKLIVFYSEEKTLGGCVWGILTYDMKKEEVTHQTYVDDLEAFENFASIHVLEDQSLLVYNDYEDVALIYDQDLNTDGQVLHQLSEKYPDFIYSYQEVQNESEEDETEANGEGSEDDLWQPGEEVAHKEYHPLMPFSHKENWGQYVGFSQYGFSLHKTAVIFDDAQDKAYFGEGQYFDRIVCANQGSYLHYEDTQSTSKDPDAWEKPHTITFTMNDYKNQQTLNTVTTKELAPEVYLNNGFCTINDTYAFLVLEVYQEDQVDHICYLWNYRADASPRPLTGVECYDVNTIDEANESLIAKLDDDYGIHIITPYQQEEANYQDFMNGVIQNSYPLDPDISKVETYSMLKQLEKEFELFPKDLFREVTKDTFDEYAIYLVQEIKDSSIGAFSSNMWINTPSEITFTEEEVSGEVPMPEVGQVYMVFQASLFSETHIPHELLHTLEYHLGDDMQNQWYQLNPETFSYEMDLYDNPERIDNLDFQYDDYFFSLYATKNDLEDRAVTFETMFMSAFDEQAPDWTQKETLQQKAGLLAQMLRQAYPSVDQMEEVFWEKYLE